MREEMRLWKRELRTKYSEVPEYYRGYEALLENNSGPTPPIPTGIYIHALTVHRNIDHFSSDLYGCVHALRYALKHATPAPRTTVLSVHTHRDHRNKVRVYVHVHVYTGAWEIFCVDCINQALCLTTNLPHTYVISAPVLHKTYEIFQQYNHLGSLPCICTYLHLLHFRIWI